MPTFLDSCMPICLHSTCLHPYIPNPHIPNPYIPTSLHPYIHTPPAFLHPRGPAPKQRCHRSTCPWHGISRHGLLLLQNALCELGYPVCIHDHVKGVVSDAARRERYFVQSRPTVMVPMGAPRPIRACEPRKPRRVSPTIGCRRRRRRDHTRGRPRRLCRALRGDGAKRRVRDRRNPREPRVGGHPVRGAAASAMRKTATRTPASRPHRTNLGDAAICPSAWQV
jgi:hypothetical protein